MGRAFYQAAGHTPGLAVLRLGGGGPAEGAGAAGSKILCEGLAAQRGLVELQLAGCGLTDVGAQVRACAAGQPA